ncbi:MAG: ATP-binding protein [Christensenellales bacterium]|jgi:predicted AAA+ superfamily ATPase
MLSCQSFTEMGKEKELNNWEELGLRLRSLAVFRALLQGNPLSLFLRMISSACQPVEQRVDSYAEFASYVLGQGGNYTELLLERILENENVYVHRRAKGLAVGDALEKCVRQELLTLQEACTVQPQDVQAYLDYRGFLPAWETQKLDLLSIYEERMQRIDCCGYGIFSKYSMFRLSDGVIVPVKTPDPVRLSDLEGYEMERGAVIDNTLALIKGKPAANVLLYGDAGTGKSSTVKAVVNEYADRGLRLIEVTKKQFGWIPNVVGALGENPLKFILFIDDLSFAKENDDFGALKAILEGSVAAKTPNIAIYATSNRRHLIKETFSSREGDDIHRNETIQEMVSLSGRFGLAVNFFQPDKEQYLEIVRSLKQKYGVLLPDEQLELEAERYALRRGGRSPRVARHFVEQLKSRE